MSMKIVYFFHSMWLFLGPIKPIYFGVLSKINVEKTKCYIGSFRAYCFYKVLRLILFSTVTANSRCFRRDCGLENKYRVKDL